MTSLISAILPVRNVAEHVRGALASVFAQEHRPDEVVVVDGGSTDATLEVVAEFADVRVVHQTSDGLADARNLGVGATGGELVAFLDADDRWLPGKLARQHGWLEAHLDVGVVTGMMVRVGPRVIVRAGARHDAGGDPDPTRRAPRESDHSTAATASVPTPTG